MRDDGIKLELEEAASGTSDLVATLVALNFPTSTI